MTASASLASRASPSHEDGVQGAPAYHSTWPSSLDYASRTNQGAGLDLAVLIQAAWRQWRLCLVIGLIAASVSSVVAWVSIPVRYTSTAHVLVRTQGGFVVEPGRDTVQIHANFLNTQTRVVTTPRVLNRALKHPDVQAVPELRQMTVKEVARRTKVEVVPNTELMTISVSHENPLAAERLANAITTEYLEEARQSEKGPINRRLETLRNALAGYEVRLQQTRAPLVALANELGSADSGSLAFRQQIELESKHDYWSRLRQVQLQLRERQQKRVDDNGQDSAVIALELEEASLQELLAGIDLRLTSISGDKALELDRLRREVELIMDAFTTTRKAIVKWELEREADERVVLHSPAERPRTPDYRNRQAGAVLFGTTAAGLVLLVIAIWEWNTGRSGASPATLA